MKMDELVKQRFAGLNEKTKSGISFMDTDDIMRVHYDKFHQWATSTLDLLQSAFGKNSAHYQNFFEHYKRFRGYFEDYENCLGIFRAAQEDYDAGYLFNLRSLIKAELLSDDILDQAKELLINGYKDPACILAGIALEVTLKEICSRMNIQHSKLDKMNSELCKAGKYNIAKQKQITAWADLRNRAAHGEWSAYNHQDVDSFIQGVERFVADFL